MWPWKSVFSVVTPYSLIDSYQHFERTCCLYLQDRVQSYYFLYVINFLQSSTHSSNLMNEAIFVYSFENLITSYQVILNYMRYNPQDSTPDIFSAVRTLNSIYNAILQKHLLRLDICQYHFYNFPRTKRLFKKVSICHQKCHPIDKWRNMSCFML
jgi:hypothetical protein